MKYFIFCIFFIVVGFVSRAEVTFTSDTLIMVQGTIMDKDSSEPISATLTYEKLPYYDDMGIAKSSSSGHFRLHLVKSHKYHITIKADGFKPLVQELDVRTFNNSMEIEKDFQLEKQVGDVEEIISLKNLIFARGRSIISAQSHEELDGLVGWMEDHPGVSIQLEGHTDFEGNQTANLKLSLDRVEAVKSYLIEKGVKKKRVLTKAFGGTLPLTRDRTDEAKARNRRVEVRVFRDDSIE